MKKEYVVSESFDKSKIEKYILSGFAESAIEFCNKEMIEGAEIYVNGDDVIVKYPEKTYMIFRIS